MCVADTLACSPASDKATFKWSIDNFSSLLDKGEGWINSRVFKIMGHDWYGLQLQLSFSTLEFVASLISYN
jgi:hypothetical protein